VYAVLFGTPGVATAHAAAEAGRASDFPYDLPDARWPNRLRVGYFTKLASGLDQNGVGNHDNMLARPANGDADVYVNTGVLPTRPFPYNETAAIRIRCCRDRWKRCDLAFVRYATLGS
jgi:hypothetical protein